jgi:hypothetical protein
MLFGSKKWTKLDQVWMTISVAGKCKKAQYYAFLRIHHL